MKLQITMPKPHEAQRQIMASLARFKVVCCGRRFGKTIFIPRMRVKRMLNGEPGAYFAPNYKMLQQYYRDTKQMLEPIITDVSKQEHRFGFIGGGSYTMWSLDSPDSARGRKYGFADVDEAAMIPSLEDAWNAVIRPTLTDLEGDAGFWSTPKGLNHFFTLFAKGQDGQNDWESFQFPTSANPYINPSEIEAARLDLPEDVFKQEYLAEFIQGEGAVFRNILANLYDGNEKPADHAGHVIVAGVDWGAVNDFTAISVACETCGKELELDRFNQIDWEFQRKRLIGVLDRWGVSYTLCEENSIGSPNLEALQREAKHRKFGGFMTTAQSKPPLIQSLALCLEQEEMQWLNIPIATRELEAYEAKRNEITNRIQYSAPEGFHDDTVIARCLVREAIEERKRNMWGSMQGIF
jgi:hypothetical protein